MIRRETERRASLRSLGLEIPGLGGVLLSWLKQASFEEAEIQRRWLRFSRPSGLGWMVWDGKT